MTEAEIKALVAATESDQSAVAQFTQCLLRTWMRRNIVEGMNIYQSLWLFSRFETFTVLLDGEYRKVDLFKMFSSGALPTLYYCLLRVTPDDMSKPYHWLTAERMQWVKDEVRVFLGEPTALALESLP